VNALCIGAAYSQSRAITGVVSDSSGEPLAGVVVSVQGSNATSLADMDGRYAIAVSGANPVLVFSYLGYATQEVVIGNRTTVDVTLAEAATGIEGVVVTALGLKRDVRALGYAVSTVTGEDMLKAGTMANPLTTLYGKAAGVGIQSGMAGPTGGVNIKIRGAASLETSSKTRPLFVVDGVPIYDKDSDMSSRGYDPLNSFDYGAGINDINPEDIESLEILKGAKASVLYGSDGANGVVLITTKRGAGTRGLGVSLSYQHTFELPHSYIEWQNEYGEGTSLEFAPLAEGQTVQKISNSRFSFGPKFDGTPIQFYDGSINPYQAYPNNFDDLFQNGHSDTFTAAVTGGNAKGSMRLSYTNMNYSGITSNYWQKRNSISFSGQVKVSDFASFEFSTNLYLIDTHNRYSNLQGIVAHGVHRSYDYNKLKAIYMTEDGYLNRELLENTNDFQGLPDSSKTMIDWWWQQNKNSNLDSKRHNITSARLTLHFTPWLYFVGQGGVDYTDIDYTRKDPMRMKDPYTGGMYSFKRDNSFVQDYYGLLNFENTYMDDRLSVHVYAGPAFNSVADNYIYVGTYGGFNYPEWYSLSNGLAFPGMPEASRVRDHHRGSNVSGSVLGTATVGWEGTYYLEFQARNDWTSTLAKESRSYFYPGVSFTWNFSDNIKIPYLNYGKLFTSFADVGRPAPRYYALQSYSIGVVDRYPDISKVTGSSDLFAGILKPERKREFELGLSSRWFNNRFEFNFSFYTNNVYDQIMSVPLSRTTGAENIRINAGDVKNWGYELYLKGTPVQTKDLKWDIILTMANQGSKVKRLYPGITSKPLGGAGYSVVAEEGKRYGEILMYDYVKNENGDRVVSANGMYALTNEMKPTGKNINPDVFGGFMTDLFWKGAFLHIGLDYKFGGSIFSYTNYYLTGLGLSKNTLPYRDEAHGGLAYYVTDGKTTPALHTDPSTNDKRLYHNGMILPGVKDNGDGTYSPNDIIISSTSYYQSFLSDMSSAFQPDALFRNDYIKLREISIGYTLPKKWSEKLKMQKVTVQLNARNLFYLYKTLPNVDAESALGTSGQNSYHEQSFYPSVRSYGFGVNVSF
jgi:iron complex outermembrane receptor protein